MNHIEANYNPNLNDIALHPDENVREQINAVIKYVNIPPLIS